MIWRCPLSGLTWCPLCYEGLRCRRSHKGHGTAIRRPKQRRKGKRVYMKRRERNGVGEKVLRASTSCSISSTFPTLAEFLAETEWEDGSSRIPGTVMLFTEDGRWKAWVHDRDQGIGAFLSNTGLQSLLSALDRALRTNDLDWRADRPDGKGGRLK